MSLGLWIASGVELGGRVAFSSMALLFVALGISLGLGRYGTTIDRQKRLVTRWCGLGKPMWRTIVSYDGVERVEMHCRFVSGGHGKGGHFVYFVTLHGNSKPIPICRRDREPEGRADADRVAKFLQLPLYDETRERVVRHPDEIGVSIGERVRSRQEAFALPPPPLGLRATLEPLADGLRLTLPRQDFSRGLLMIGGFGLIPILLLAMGPGYLARSQAERIRDDIVMSSLHDDMASMATLMSVCTGTLALGLGVLFGWVLIGAAMTRVVVEATPQEVAVKGGAWRTNLPASQIEEVRVEGSGASWYDRCFVIVRSASKMARFGGHISRAEGEYLAELIKAGLVQQTPSPSAKE